MDETSPTVAQKTETGPVGPLFATVIIVLVFLIGGVYFLVKQEQHIRTLKLQQQEAQLPANS